MITCRPSKLPLAHECPSSLLPAEHPISAGSAASDVGQAQHYVAGAIVLGKPYDVAAVAKSFSVDRDDLSILAFQTARAWNYLGRWFVAPRVEYVLRSELLGGGTADVLHHDGDTAAVNDWKSGRVQRNYRWQLWGYAYSARETLGMPRSGVIDSACAWVRTGDVEMHGFTDAELDAMAEEHRALEGRIGKVYSPGEHCGFCARRHECGAYADALRTTTTALAPIAAAIEGGTASGVTIEQLVSLYPMAKLYEKVLEAYGEMLKAALADGVRLPIGDGRVLYLAEKKRVELDPVKTYDALLAAGPDGNEILECMRASKGALEKWIESKAPRGQKKAAREAMLERLSAAGAVSQTIQQRLTAAKEK
jgi:hypothetical protein